MSSDVLLRIKEMIASKEIRTVSDYFNLCQAIELEIGNRQPQDAKTVKVAILTSFTSRGIKETLFVKCYKCGIVSRFYSGAYHQYSQEIFNKNSGLYKFSPDLVILFIDIRSVMGESYLLPYLHSDAQRRNWVNEKLEEMKILVQTLKENSSTMILLHNFEVPSYSPLGIVENKQGFGVIEAVENLNTSLRDAFKTDPQVFVFDYEAFCSRIGKQNVMDYKMYYLGDLKLDLQHIPELCDEYLSYIKPLMSMTRKCIVVDLDHVLWGGVVGEDGLGGIRLGPTPEGSPFLEFQKCLLSLFNRGVVLAVNSRNNPEDVLEVFRKHPYSILKEEHFASLQINWNDKISNLRAIAEEINIGMDSLLFIDDDKLIREMVRGIFPEIRVVELPEDPSLYVKTLMELDDFNTLQITGEDKRRGGIYEKQRKRKEFKGSSIDLSTYLKKLRLSVTVERANPLNIPRISQLTQKTNQFNMTTRRYQEEDIRRFVESGNFLVLSAKVEDKYGDNGISGVAIVEKKSPHWRIDTFLLSCRVIGLRVEEALLACVLSSAKREAKGSLIGEFISNKKNYPARGFYENNGFRLCSKDNGVDIFEYDTARQYKTPDFIKLIEK